MMTACWVRLSCKLHASRRPDAYGRGSPEAGFHSYRLRLREHLGTKLQRQVGGGEQVDADAEQGLQFDLQAAQVEQGCAGQRVDQQIEVAALLVGAMKTEPN